MNIVLIININLCSKPNKLASRRTQERIVKKSPKEIPDHVESYFRSHYTNVIELNKVLFICFLNLLQGQFDPNKKRGGDGVIAVSYEE